MKSIFKKIAALALACAAILAPTAVMAYGPTEGNAGRKYFDWNDTSTYPKYTAFNSFKNNPVWGFEPDFMSIRPLDSDHWADNDIINLQPGKTYEVVAYYHNNAPLGTYPSKNARMAIEFPELIKGGKDYIGNAVLTADNATPNKIYTSLTFRTDSDVLLRYVQNTAEVHLNNGEIKKLPNSGQNLFNGSGQLLGNNLDGVVPGCDGYSGFIQFQITADQPNFDAEKTVRIAGSTTWSESVTAHKNDIVEFQLKFKNTGTTDISNITFKDTLPAGLQYVSGSTKIMNANHPSGSSIADGVTTDGILVPTTHNPGGATYILFQAKVVADVADCGSSRLINRATISNSLGSITDPADVVVVSTVTDCTEVPPCDVPGYEHLPADDPNCKEVVTPCDVPGKEHLPANDPNCKEVTKEKCKTPGKEHLEVGDPNCYDLPVTGAGEILVGAIGIGSVATATAYYIASRRQLKK